MCRHFTVNKPGETHLSLRTGKSVCHHRTDVHVIALDYLSIRNCKHFSLGLELNCNPMFSATKMFGLFAIYLVFILIYISAIVANKIQTGSK